ncbi:DNA-binding protein BIN4 [Arachis ipaensis]|uniref:DNA-binding protein BIN4 n=1 Tax=Arachis ipaensis TaxID=130454 RepID=UPI0007AEE937|nr:DNA-binding protein BIN4 [Arachis ipaensis]
MPVCHLLYHATDFNVIHVYITFSNQHRETAMSDSRESSPDWLRSFQVPSHSPLILSSDSKSLHDDSLSIEDETDAEGSSLEISKSKSKSKSKSRSTGLGKSRYKSSPRKTLEVAAVEIEGCTTSSRRKKLEKQNAKGDIEERKISIDSNNDMHVEHKESVYPILSLSSDSESCLDHSPKKEIRNNQVEASQQQIPQLISEEAKDKIILGNDGKSPSRKGSKGKSSQKPIHVEEDHSPVKGKKTKGSAKERGSGGDLEAEEEETCEKLIETNVSSSRLPLVLSEKVQRTKALVECQGDSIDLSGDVGAVGRVIISDSASRDQEMHLDLKGTIYKTSIVPCRTFCVVSFGHSEAKIEAIMNDFIQLEPQSNVYEAETMVEGTLDGFAFDSDEEAGKMPKATQTDQNEHAEEETHSKSKGKGDKKTGAEKKRGRSTGGKPQPKTVKKKAPKKAPNSKKAKMKN